MKTYYIEFELNGEYRWSTIDALSETDAEFRLQNWAIGKGECKLLKIEEC